MQSAYEPSWHHTLDSFTKRQRERAQRAHNTFENIIRAEVRASLSEPVTTKESVNMPNEGRYLDNYDEALGG
jgi:hypothetical protein